MSLVAAALLATARSLRDRFPLGTLGGVLIAVLAIAERVRPARYFWTIGGAAIVSLVALFITWRRERTLPWAHTQRRDLLYPFLACAGITVTSMVITALAHSPSAP